MAADTLRDHKQKVITLDSTIVNGVIPAVAKVAKKNKLDVIDLRPVVKIKTDEMQRDGIHPTAKGAKKIAEIVAEAIKVKGN